MRLCEICGTKENDTLEEHEQVESVTLHLCENCREDRKHNFE